MTSLLLKPSAPDPEGLVHRVTPESAGWSYVGFEVYDMQPGQTLRRPTEGCEVCLVVVSGRATMQAGGEDFGTLGGRSAVGIGGVHRVADVDRAPDAVLGVGMDR